MTRFGWMVLAAVALAGVGIVLLLWGFARQSSPDLEGPEADTSAVDPASLSIYSNGVYGFSVLYPASATIEDSFAEGEGFAWRANAQATGTAILRIRTTRGEVRVGASSDARARSTCETPGLSEAADEPLTVGTTTWRVFVFEALGTDDERRVRSYRTLHDGQCFALETYEPVSGVPAGSPADDPSFIVRNFTFAR